MNPFCRSLAVTVALLTTAAAGRAAEVVDPAELFAADTLAYAELHDPAAAGPAFAALFNGTPLEDSVALIHARRDKATLPGDLTGKRELALLGMLTSPELAAEVKKLRGVAVGVTGVNDRGEPQGALAVLTGDSPAVGLAARAFLTTTSVRKVGAVGGVSVYQFRQPTFSYDPNDGSQKLVNDKPPAEGTHEPTFAYLPGLFVVGTDKAAVGDIVTRFRGQGKAALATSAGFREAVANHRRPGVFFYVNVAAAVARRDAARRAGVLEAGDDTFAVFDLVANAKAVRYLAGTIGLRDSGLSASAAVAFDPAGKSPLLDLMSGSGAKVELLRHAPAPATVALAVTLPETNRAATVINFLDAVAKANGRLGRLPGEAIKELEEKYKASITDGLIGKTRAATVVMPAKQELSKGAVPLPLLILHAETADAATAWEDFLPKLVGDLGGTNPVPSSETIGGVKVWSLPAAGLPWKAAVHYARNGPDFVVGLDRKLVAASVVGGKTTVAAVADDPPAAVGTFAAGSVIRRLTEAPKVEGPVVLLTPVGPATLPRPGAEELANPAKAKEHETKAWGAFLTALDALPPPRVTARRVEREVRFEVWQPELRGAAWAAAVAAGVNWFDLSLDASRDPNAPGLQQFRGLR